MEATTDPVLNHILPAMNRLREPWISQFFNPTKEQHLSQLEYALKNQTLTGTLHLSSATTINEGRTPDLTFILAPSFSTGTTTVGFDITQRASTNPMDNIPSQRSVSRVVRDDATGIFLSISQLPTHTEIALSRITPNGRTISLTSLTNAAYDKLLANCASPLSLSTIETLNSGIISTLYGEDNLSPAPSAKLHPMDFAAEQRNVGCFVNGFQTIAQLKQYNNGNLMGNDWCFAKMNMAVTRDGVFVKDMRDWAIQQAVTACRIRLPGLCVPGSQIDEDGHIGDIEMGTVRCTGKVAEFRPDDIVKILAGLDGTFDDPLFDGNTFALMNGGDDEQIVSLPKDGLEDIDISQDITLSKSSVISAITETPPQTSVAQDEVTNPTKDGDSSPPQSRNNPVTGNYLLELAPKQSPNNAYVIEHMSPRRVVPIAPADVSNKERTIMSESQRKEERRRARNRASALRSNERKRLYVKKLKEDIAAAGERETVLRERERLLREKNWELRSALRQ